MMDCMLKNLKATLEDACSLVTKNLQLRGMEVPLNQVQGLVQKVEVRVFQVGDDQSPCEGMTGSFRLQ